jgi:hypothetical protein
MNFVDSHSIFYDFIIFRWLSLVSTDFNIVSIMCIKMYMNLMIFVDFHLILYDFNTFHSILFDFIDFHWVSIDFIWFLWFCLIFNHIILVQWFSSSSIWIFSGSVIFQRFHVILYDFNEFPNFHLILLDCNDFHYLSTYFLWFQWLWIVLITFCVFSIRVFDFHLISLNFNDFR